MIIETLLALSLAQSPILPPAPVFAASYSSARSPSFSAPARSSSFSAPSRSFSTPSRSFSPPSKAFSPPPPAARSPASDSSFSSPVTTSPGVQRISKQTAVKPVPASPTTPLVTPRPIQAPPVQAPRIVTRETYVERYHDGGIGSSPWFWLWAMDNNRGGSQQQPTQVVVANTDGEQVKVPASQLVVQKDTWSPLREFFVFSLGAGLGVLLGRRLFL